MNYIQTLWQFSSADWSLRLIFVLESQCLFLIIASVQHRTVRETVNCLHQENKWVIVKALRIISSSVFNDNVDDNYKVQELTKEETKQIGCKPFCFGGLQCWLKFRFLNLLVQVNISSWNRTSRTKQLHGHYFHLLCDQPYTNVWSSEKAEFSFCL